MSADARLLPKERYKAWFCRERDLIMDAYLSGRIGSAQYLQSHLNLSRYNEAYIRARIQLYGDGYLPNPPF